MIRGDNDNSDTITIKSGATAHRNGTTTKVKRIFAHPMHDMSTIDYDFALLELEDELQFGESREAIKLAESKDFYIDGSMALVTGWGITQNWNESCRILRGAGVQIIAQDKCVKMYEHEGVITDRMICAGFEQGGIDGGFHSLAFFHSGFISLLSFYIYCYFISLSRRFRRAFGPVSERQDT